ncbi:MAG: hypothetical protein E7452_06075 [Ruminococcaceae bacterium]|nr:hypothetical protein [Oscillospiraceae bacterium]
MGKYSQNSYENLETGAVSEHNPNAIKMTYTDPNGAQQTGYSIDNRMYKDEAGLQRIDNGSIVTNASGTKSWVMTDAGGVDYGEYQRQQAMAAQPSEHLVSAQNAAMAAANQRTEADIAAIEQNRPKIDAQYNDLARQNYQGYMQSGKALANSLASQGLYNSGYSDTAKIAQTTNYRAQHNANERARLEALAELDHQISLARLNGSANLNELEAQYAQMLNEQVNADREYAYRQQRDWIADQRYDDEWAFTQNQWEYQKERDKLAQDNWQKEFDAAQNQVLWEQRMYEQNAQSEAEQRAIANAYAAADIGDFSQLEALGIDTTNAKKLYEIELQGTYRNSDGNVSSSGNNTSVGSTFGGSDVSAEFDKLYENNKENYYQTIEYARSFAENQYGVPKRDFYSQLNNNAKYLEKTYGENFGELYKQVVLENAAALHAAAAANAAEPVPAVTFDDAETRVREVLYSGADGTRITDPEQLTQLVKEINQMDISNDALARLLAKYGLGEIWNSMNAETDKNADH